METKQKVNGISMLEVFLKVEVHSNGFIGIMFDKVKLGDKERFDKEQSGVKKLFMDYQPFYTINVLLDKELLPI